MTKEEINNICDIDIEYCNKYLEAGKVEFNSFKQDFTTIKHLVKQLGLDENGKVIPDKIEIAAKAPSQLPAKPF